MTKMGVAKNLILSVLATLLHLGYGCQMEGVGNWLLTQDAEVLDTYRGIVFSRSTANIQNVTGITVGGSVNYALYLNVELSEEDGYFTISTNDGYEQYEENETSEFISFAVNFRCTDASTNSLIFSIRVVDTNNNPPTFRPTNDYEFTITPPLPPGFQITGIFGNDIIVRDIDLTTSRIDFTIQDNPYFEIAYEGRSTTDQKEFVASLKTKVLIRNLPEDVQLAITATDVDATGDPPITTMANIRVRADETFLFPDEPVFTQPFYLATYENNQVVVEQTISLQQGYDDEVTFSLEGEYSESFGLTTNGNEVSIVVTTALSTEVLRVGRLILVVRAEREYTSGGSATVIVELPEVLGLKFEQVEYTGQIVDNVLQPLQLTLVQGHEEEFNVTLQNEYASYFSTSVQGNVVTLSMMPLDAQILDRNNFIVLQLTAANDFSSTLTVVTLDIIKDDNFTPVFEKAIYLGEYDLETGLSMEQIKLEQGYDDTVNFSLEGGYSEYFSLTNECQVVILASSGIPNEVWTEQLLLLTIGATKPRTVTATTTVSITLPLERQLAFKAPTYSGTLQEETLSLTTIVLAVGYSVDVNFTLTGDYANYFRVSLAGNEVTVNLSEALPGDVILENNFLTLTLTAAGLHAVPTSTTILIEIIKQDLSTPVFTENIYRGTYSADNSIEIKNISLSQGYDPSVTFKLDGEHSHYFQITNDANNLNLALSSDIPLEVIFMEKILLFNILAEKPSTVGAHAAISIAFPQELTDSTVMRFSRNTYVGSLENNALILENIILETGYDFGTEFSLKGEYASYFSLQNTNNVTSITLQDSLPEEVVDGNTFIILEVEASRERAISASSTVVIGFLQKDIVPLAFSSAYYKTVYADDSLDELTITLTEGYEDTVTFELQGQSSVWFTIINVGNHIYLTRNLSTEIPEDVLENNDYFLFTIAAHKPETESTRAAIFIHLPKETPETVIVRFSQTSYVGRIENGELYAPTITVLGEREPIFFNVTGEYAQFFELVQISGTDIQIQLREKSLPENIDELPFILIDIEARYPEAISGYTTVIFQVIKLPEIITPVFEQAYYIGEYSKQRGLQFEQSIRLIQGFDESVVFTLAGDDAQWFDLTSTDQNSLTLVVNSTGLEQILDRSYLVLSVIASKTGIIPGQVGVIVHLSDLLVTTPLSFAKKFYVGSYQNNSLEINNIILQEGYSSDLNITLSGDHVEYFQLTNQDGTFILQLLSELPENVINDNIVLVFTLEVNLENAKAHTTIVLELIKMKVTPIAFDEAYYVGSYSIIDGFTFDSQIILIEGYDETVSFSLEGDDSQWFGIVDNQYPLILTQTVPIPNEVVFNNQQLIFVVFAEYPGNFSARSTIIISLIDDTTLLEFERNIYLGTIESDATSDIDSIVLTKGYSQDVSFVLHGDLESYFLLVQNDSSITVVLQKNIPDELIPRNRIILLELQASAPQALSAYTSIVFGIIRNELESLQFSEIYYTGIYSEPEGLYFQNNITLAEGYDQNVQFFLEGELSNYFGVSMLEESVIIILETPFPEELIPENKLVILELHATAPEAVAAHTAIIIKLIQQEEVSYLEQLIFDQAFYTGFYTEADGFTMANNISLAEGYTENAIFTLEGDSSQFFQIVMESENSISLTLTSSIPSVVIFDNHNLVFTIRAERSDALAGRAVIVIALLDEFNENMTILGFDRITYVGSVEDESVIVEPITLVKGYSEAVSFRIRGDLESYFDLTSDGALVTVTLQTTIPDQLIPEAKILILELEASAPQSETAFAGIALRIVREQNAVLEQLVFTESYYTGHYTESDGLVFNDHIILLQGYGENTTFVLEGDSSQYFEALVTENSVSLRITTSIPSAVVMNNQQLIFTIRADKPKAITTRATIVISLLDDYNNTLPVLGFNRISFIGSISDDIVNLDPIVLSEGSSDIVQFTLLGDLQNFFTLKANEIIITLTLTSSIPEELIPSNGIIVLEIQASSPGAVSAHATIVLEVFEKEIPEITFSDPFYTGLYTKDDGLILYKSITLSEGFDESVQFKLEGDDSQWFQLTASGNLVSLSVYTPIPESVLESNRKLIFLIIAQNSRSSSKTTIIISLINEARGCDTWFEKILYEGIVQNGVVSHETISVTGYNGTNVQIIGTYAELFLASFADGGVTVQGSASVSLPADVSYVALELLVDTDEAVLLLDVLQTETPEPPIVTFSSASYILRIEVSQTGFLGRVQATADNGEAVSYTLAVDESNLLQRVSISEAGELYLSAPANSGVYSFQVIATTVFTRISGTADVYLTVEAITIWDDGYILPPLQILDRDEESAHENLVPFNATAFEGCRFNLNNRWPIDQTWLYVDDSGLHARAIDREHASIAFMALSQIQVELILECDSDSTHTKRALDSPLKSNELENLGPYDYGTRKWILTDSINHNPRRSFINLIVNDINDNYPIFVGKQDEPIVVAYPVAELEERVLPRALAEVKATDADIGENAALVYWSADEVLAVSPTTGSVHVRDISRLQDNASFTVFATDRNGQGLTGSLNILVKLLDRSHIAVVTVKNAFLNDENQILIDFTNALGYEVKALRSSVTSETEPEEVDSRGKREAIISTGASLQLYLYGLIEREPVDVEQLTRDINTYEIETLIIASTVSLQDHLESLEICVLPGRDTGLFVSTIVLAVLLFILIVATAVWFFLKWRKNPNYEEFSDLNSLSSRNDSPPASTVPKAEATKPRINIEELKRSEKRLQEMLEASDSAPSTQPMTQKVEKPTESKVIIPELPLVIQSIDKLKAGDESDDEDEFGERRKKTPKRKSVVTFNENVEKIIHVEDPPDDSEVEIYKL